MTMHRMIVTLAVLVLLLRSASAQAPPIVADGAWARQPAPSRDVTAAYVVLTNTTSEPVRVVSGQSALARSVELHEMTNDGSMMRMKRVPEIVVPAYGRVELKPGGLHLMIFGLRQSLKGGDRMPVTLTLANGATVTLDVEVRSPESRR